MDVFLPIIGGLFLAQWLMQQHHWPSLTIVILPVVGLFLGIGLLYKRQVQANQRPPHNPDDTSHDPPAAP
jgi:uncharacterized membrane protein